MCGRCHGYVVLCYVNAKGKTLFVDIWEVTFCFLGVFVCDIKIDVVIAAVLHFVVYGACHDVAWCKGQARVIFVHELLSVLGAQYASVSAHGLGDEERWPVARVVERCGVELYELHVLYRSLSAVYHSDTVACSYKRVCGCLVDRTATAGGHSGHLAQECMHLVGGDVKHVCAVALDALGLACDLYSQVVLGKNLDGEMVVKDGYVGVLAYGLDE